MKKLLCISLLSLLLVKYVKSQDCSWTPADCPDESSIEYSQDSILRIRNGLLPQEIFMQNSMRALVTGMMEKVAKALHWQMMELDEVSNLNPFQGAGTPYPLRSPREFGIAFQFIVNNDSLQAWRNWLLHFSVQYDNTGQAAFQRDNEIQNSPQFRRYYDSVQYYTKLYTDFITAHPKISPSEETRMKNLLKEQDNFINKMNTLRQNGGNASGESLGTLDKEKIIKTLQYREGTLVQVFFEFNPTVGLINTSGSIQAKDFTLQGTQVAREVHISDPELNSLPWHFENCKNMRVLLLGHWNSKPSEQNYTAAYGLNGQGDERTPKKIKSDKVQTIAVHILGSDRNTGAVLPFINITELNHLLAKN